MDVATQRNAARIHSHQLRCLCVCLCASSFSVVCLSSRATTAWPHAERSASNLLLGIVTCAWRTRNHDCRCCSYYTIRKQPASTGGVRFAKEVASIVGALAQSSIFSEATKSDVESSSLNSPGLSAGVSKMVW